MKTISLLVFLPLLLLLGACAGAGGMSGGTADDRVRVSFENPANFTDVKARYMDEVVEDYLDDLRNHIERRARGYLSPNETLSMTFTDIDMAGEFEPWRLNARDVRLVKSIYPPRAEFTWVLADGNGTILNEGRERLVDMSFDLRGGFNLGSDPLYHEKQMLDDWMRRTLRRR